jgi:hypothetical protein
VPRTTDRPVQCIPARTSPSGMIGSAAPAAGVTAAKLRRRVETARRIKGGAAYRALQKWHLSAEEQ